MFPGMGTPFDTLAAADALEAAGMDRSQAKACATQLQAAAGAGEAVTRPELDAALAGLKAELLDRMTAQNWRLFGGVVAVAGLAVAAAKYLP